MSQLLPISGSASASPPPCIFFFHGGAGEIQPFKITFCDDAEAARVRAAAELDRRKEYSSIEIAFGPQTFFVERDA